jgi:hypothetical protein
MSLYVPLSKGTRDRPACCMAVTWLVLVLLTADGPILVRAALGTGDGGAIEAFDFSGALAQRAGIGWYGHVYSFSSVDAGKPRAAAPQDRRAISCAGLAWATATMPDRSIGRRSPVGIITNLFSRGNVVERIHGGRHHPCLRPAIVSDVGIEGRLSGRHSSWRGASCR